jgi:hypothetical protein
MPSPAAQPGARDLAALDEPRHLAGAGDDLEAEQLRVLRAMPRQFLVCRGDGHNWRTERGWGVVVADRLGNQREYVNWGWRVRRCLDCGAEVEKHYSPTMALLGGGRADYPTDGTTGTPYLTKGLGRIPPRLARLVLWEREAGPQPEAGD